MRIRTKIIRKTTLQINTKNIFYSFINNSKQSWKEIILWSVITFLITQYVIGPPIDMFLDSIADKPEIKSNVVIFENYKFEENLFNVENQGILFYKTGNKQFMFLVDGVTQQNYRDFSDIVSPASEICEGCRIVSFYMKNDGKKTAQRVSLDVKSSVIPRKEYSSPSVDINCGGQLDKKGCFISIDDFNPDENMIFSIFLNDQSDFLITCTTLPESKCFFTYLKIKVINFVPGSQMFSEGKVVPPPNYSDGPDKRLFAFNPDQLTGSPWEEINIFVENVPV